MVNDLDVVEVEMDGIVVRATTGQLHPIVFRVNLVSRNRLRQVDVDFLPLAAGIDDNQGFVGGDRGGLFVYQHSDVDLGVFHIAFVIHFQKNVAWNFSVEIHTDVVDTVRTDDLEFVHGIH